MRYVAIGLHRPEQVPGINVPKLLVRLFADDESFVDEYFDVPEIPGYSYAYEYDPVLRHLLAPTIQARLQQLYG